MIISNSYRVGVLANNYYDVKRVTKTLFYLNNGEIEHAHLKEHHRIHPC